MRGGILQYICYIFVSFADTVRKEAATITAVFPSPNEVMSILVQVPGRTPSILLCFSIFWVHVINFLLFGAASFRAENYSFIGQIISETISCEPTSYGRRGPSISE